MFRMKLRIFEKDEVKNAKGKDAEKSDIRKAESPFRCNTILCNSH